MNLPNQMIRRSPWLKWVRLWWDLALAAHNAPQAWPQRATMASLAIYILNAYQRRGIGKRLAGAMASDLLRRSYRGVALWVLQGNAQARHFYEWCDGMVVAAREDVRGPHVLAEVAYGWPEIASLSRRLNG
jgi:ribosomal protein S18 acetylase RimI-like enzyme